MRRKYIKKQRAPTFKHVLKNFVYPFLTLSEGLDYLKYYPIYGRDEFNRYRIDSPDFIHIWDSLTDFMLKFIKGIQINYNNVMLRISGLYFDTSFIEDKSMLCNTLNEEEDMESAYYVELYALRMSFPKTFLLPSEFRLSETSPLYDTFDPKRRRRRSKYRTSKHYKHWLIYSNRYNDLIALFMPLHNKEYLEQKKKLFESLPSFDPEIFLPRDKIEALHFFSIFGSPSKNCRNMIKAKLFLNLLLAGNYMNHFAPASFSRVLITRNLLMHHALDASIFYYKKEQFVKPVKQNNESLLLFNIRIFYLRLQHFFYFFNDRFFRRLEGRKNHFISFVTLWRNRLRFWFRFYFVEGWGIVRSESYINFYRNPASFLWYMSPNKVKVFIMTWYMIGIEILHDNRTEKYFDVNWTDPSDAFTETWFDKLLDTCRFFYYDCVKYPLTLLLRPWFELLLLFPIYFLIEKILNFFVNFITLKNNVWHSFLNIGSKSVRSMRGWWWKNLFIVIKITLKLFFFLLFIYLFIFEFNFIHFYNFLHLEEYMLLSWLNRAEFFVLYVACVLYVGMVIFGSYAIKEHLWLETGPSQFVAIIVSYILWSWRVDPTLSIHVYYPSTWLDFSVLENDGDFTYDRTTVVPVRYEWLATHDATPSKKYYHRSFNWRLGYSGVALGSESDLIQEFKNRND